jgi:hypothetical protein
MWKLILSALTIALTAMPLVVPSAVLNTRHINNANDWGCRHEPVDLALIAA